MVFTKRESRLNEPARRGGYDSVAIAAKVVEV
jgi:hypothetical protein